MASFSLSTLPWKTQLAVFVSLSLGAAGVFYYFHEMPAQARIAVHEKEIAGVQTQIEKGAATARQLPEFRQKVADLQTRLESLRPILPDEKDAADLLRRVHTLAMQSNLTILGFRPQSVNTRTLHAEWPINLELEGTYHNLGLFLDRVSKVPRIINVSGLVIEARSDPQPNATITVKCTATTFVLIDAPAAAPEAGKKTRAKAPKKS
ncbi:MAG: type 4a pilus biogenesis protein PilO [Acidobacteria bacterium]|nr:type 4a pilus biogenesis protein PilO [Acidobacteriota bacterium]